MQLHWEMAGVDLFQNCLHKKMPGRLDDKASLNSKCFSLSSKFLSCFMHSISTNHIVLTILSSKTLTMDFDVERGQKQVWVQPQNAKEILQLYLLPKRLAMQSWLHLVLSITGEKCVVSYYIHI